MSLCIYPITPTASALQLNNICVIKYFSWTPLRTFSFCNENGQNHNYDEKSKELFIRGFQLSEAVHTVKSLHPAYDVDVYMMNIR